jgi:arginine decarboxylase
MDCHFIQGTPMKRNNQLPHKNWNTDEATEFYKINRWGLNYFTVNEKGNLCLCDPVKGQFQVDLKLIVDELEKRKINPPILIRVMNILEDRINTLANCFQQAIDSCEYRSKYIPLFPIKVNQQKHVLDSIRKYGEPYNLGLEAGSKAELIAILALSNKMENLLICNGYKDSGFVQIVGMAHKMGKKIIPVIEKYSEIKKFLTYYHETGIMPDIGVRLKVASKGMGQWANSGGDRSKFGLRILEIMRLVNLLKDEGLLSKLKLLHFHIGSQISQIGVVKQALTEAGRVYVELFQAGAGMEYFDVGGGLGVDYDGSSHNTFNSINYSIQEYANDVIYRIQQICDQHQVPHPVILSESGRFLAAHYSFLVTNIATYSQMNANGNMKTSFSDKTSPVLEEMIGIFEDTEKGQPNFLESYHDAIQARSEAVNLFNLGYLTLSQRADFERVFWSTMLLIQNHLDSMDRVPVEMENLELNLADTYFANFSLFQSLPDSWAINQLFPLIPIHRLNERPTRRAIVVDLTCDSDGSIKQYVGQEESRPFVWLHDPIPDEPYYIGIFLTGAYQETLGELYNLFGDTHAVQLDILGPDQYRISSFLKGDRVQDVLKYVGYSAGPLLNQMRDQIEDAVQQGSLTLEDSANLMEQFENALKGYTYFSSES